MRAWRVLLLCLVALALPLQGWAAALALHCAAGGVAGVAAASADGAWPAAAHRGHEHGAHGAHDVDGRQASHPAHAAHTAHTAPAAHGHRDHHDGHGSHQMLAGPVADAAQGHHADPTPAPADAAAGDTLSAAHGCAGCAACAACCLGVALAGPGLAVAAPEPGGPHALPAATTGASFLTSGPERPPRPVLA